MNHLLELREDIEAMQEKLQERLKLLNATIAAECKCESKDNVINKRYYDGDYYNTSYTEITTRCGVCGKTLNEKRNRHGSYS